MKIKCLLFSQSILDAFHLFTSCHRNVQLEVQESVAIILSVIPPTYHLIHLPCNMLVYGAFTLHPTSRSEHPSPNLYAIETLELMFGVYTDPSLSLRFLSWTSVSELDATCSDFLRHGRPSTSGVMKRACSKAPVHVVATKFGLKWSWTQMTVDPSLGCSVNTILSGSWTRSQTRMLRQCKWKCALT